MVCTYSCSSSLSYVVYYVRMIRHLRTSLTLKLKPLGEIPSLACEPVFVFVLVLVLVFVLVLFLHVHVLVCLVLDTWTAAVRVIFIRVLSVSSRVVVLLVFSAVFSCCCSCCV